MEILKLAENFYRYHFPSDENNNLGKNVYVLLNKQEALLIEAGYQEDARLILGDLGKKNIKIHKVIPSHFHPDHVEGILLLDEAEVLGNQHAVRTLSQFYEGETLKALSPDTIINPESRVQFGDFSLRFKEAPGHSDCSLLIFINDQFLNLGDLFLRTENREEVLPYVHWAGVQDHIRSLQTILEYKDKKFLLGHGLCPLGYEELKAGIYDRIIYLQALLDSNNRISAEDAVKDCSKPFQFLRWREQVK